ncbi:hypothetical protein K438DRAFT_1814906, partial [Mycena galopus ATCC 62051]
MGRGGPKRKKRHKGGLAPYCARLDIQWRRVNLAHRGPSAARQRAGVGGDKDGRRGPATSAASSTCVGSGSNTGTEARPRWWGTEERCTLEPSCTRGSEAARFDVIHGRRGDKLVLVLRRVSSIPPRLASRLSRRACTPCRHEV